MFRIFASLFYFELVLLFRQRQVVLLYVGFFILLSVLFPIALGTQASLLHKLAPGLLWLSALLASLLVLESWLRADLEDHALEVLILSGHPLNWILMAKLSAFWLAIALPLLLVVPPLSLLFSLTGAEIWLLEISLVLGLPTVIALGATCKTLILGLNQGSALLGLLILPLTLPVLIMGINTLTQLHMGLSVNGNLAFLGGLSLLSFAALPFAMAAALRLGMET